MNYFTKKTIHYSVFLGELLNLQATQVFEKIGHIFLRKNDAEIKMILSDHLFAGLAEKSLSVYLRYANSFSSKKISQDEQDAIKIKINVLKTVERFRDACCEEDMLAYIASNIDDQKQFAVLMGLAFYVQGEQAEKIIPMLKRAKKEVSGIDACLALLTVDPENRAQHFIDLKKSKAIGLYPEIIQEVKKQYNLFEEKKTIVEG